MRFDWQTRAQQLDKQRKGGGADQGSRSAVTGGAQMNGFIELLTKLVREAWIERAHQLRPVGTDHNSPAFQRWEQRWECSEVPQGRPKRKPQCHRHGQLIRRRDLVFLCIHFPALKRRAILIASLRDKLPASRFTYPDCPICVQCPKPGFDNLKSQRDFVTQPSVATTKEGLLWVARSKRNQP
jgi:hypothetical protein